MGDSRTRLACVVLDPRQHILIQPYRVHRVQLQQLLLVLVEAGLGGLVEAEISHMPCRQLLRGVEVELGILAGRTTYSPPGQQLRQNYCLSPGDEASAEQV